jgi:hypothetical protein
MRGRFLLILPLLSLVGCADPVPQEGEGEGEGDTGPGEDGAPCEIDDDCLSGDCSDRRNPICVPHDCDADDGCGDGLVCATSRNVPWLGNQCVSPANLGEQCASFNDLSETTSHPCAGGLLCAHVGVGGLGGESVCVFEGEPRALLQECDADHECADGLRCDSAFADWSVCLGEAGSACDPSRLSCADGLECSIDGICELG